jgi:hypothetical protein
MTNGGGYVRHVHSLSDVPCEAIVLVFDLPHSV